MKKNVILKRNKSICDSIDNFLLSNEQKLLNQPDDNFQSLINLFQDTLNQEKNNWSRLILDDINNQKEDLCQRKEYIKMYRKEKANILNQLIIINRRLKRNIQENNIRKNEIDIEKRNQSRDKLLFKKQIEGLEASKQILFQIYKKAKRIKIHELDNFHTEIDNMKKNIKKEFYQIQNEIYEYQKKKLMEKEKEALEHLKAAQKYYLTEIDKLQHFNKSINLSLNSLCAEFDILPIEFSSKEIKNKSLFVGEDAIFNELSKIVSIRKRIGPKPSAKMIVSYIIKKLKEKDNAIINNLKQREDNCAILKEKIRRAEIKTQLMSYKDGSFHSNIFDKEQSEIAKNIHDIKLMQRNLFD